jgi:hypothetical protein
MSLKRVSRFWLPGLEEQLETVQGAISGATTMRPASEESNMKHAFDLIREALDDPSVLDDIPDGATVIFLPDDDQEQLEANLEIAIQAARAGENVYLRHVRTKTAIT